MQAYFGERAHLDQSSAILDSNSEEAWGETKMRPREWEFNRMKVWRRIYDRELQNACAAGYLILYDIVLYARHLSSFFPSVT